MKLRPIILITLVVCLPIFALTWAAWQIAENEQLVIQQRYRTLMEDRLRDVKVTVDGFFEDLQREMNLVLEIDSFEADILRQVGRRETRLQQTFVLNPAGRLQYPDPAGELNSTERKFLLKASQMFSGQDLKAAVQRSEGGQNTLISEDVSTPVVQTRDTGTSTELPQKQAADSGRISSRAIKLQQFKTSSGWFLWYWDRGLNLIVWQRRPSGHIVGAALERARWMSDLVARLPETIVLLDDQPDVQNRIPNRVRLVNSSADTVYQWGIFEPEEGAQALCEISLAEPIGSWRLQCFVPAEQLISGTGRSVYFGLFSSLFATAVVVAAIAVFFLRDYSRDMKEAQQQVSFVNQVSHELKTPLTNIRMYAELLESDLDRFVDDDAQRPRQRLQIILSEGQRLTRLIGNVLTFARQQRDTLQLHRADVCPDQAVRRIVDRFRPALEEQDVEIVLETNSPKSQCLDCDFLEQILGNLISNVEKYATSGNRLKVHSHQDGDKLVLDVVDYGPGIPPAMQEQVFQPFSRLTNDVNYAAGTGIGLSIARELARLHGGDLILKPTESGCWFQVILSCQGAA